ncbi:DUF5723 family protein [Hymenobacter sp. GOD-10R]|uniref:DUF5723 family protein n=1 Tax=Hymenobacter sp. GOD-10R TaxID=3093922 RepID=UPI002D7A2593|nr:DUF5723 family protein [Hymenobacter sp. GOD-10R]WRQ29729.1 DUF5723 family protein [Hymenobacter sp. GOD-10R]
MNKRFTLLLATLGLVSPTLLHAQNELGNFSATGRGGVINTFATDYQAVGVNPANLGRAGGARVAFTIGEISAAANSQSLTRDQLKSFVYDRDQKLTLADKQGLARSFTSDNALNVNAGSTAFGLSVQLPVIGGIAVSSRQRVVGHVELNKDAAELLFLGSQAPIYANYDPNSGKVPLISEVLAGSAVQASFLNEYNIAWGKKLLDLPAFQLSAGVGYRYVQGFGVLDIRIQPGDLKAYSSLSPVFNIDYSSISAGNPNFNAQVDGGLEKTGKGHGFDLGAAAEIGKMIRVGLSVTDIGHMTWEGNLLSANDQKLKKLNSTGVGTYNFFKEASEILASGTDSLFQYQAGQARRANLPTKLRAGFGVRISEFLETGLDVTLPLNSVAGNYVSPYVGAGIDYSPKRWLRLSSGLAGGAGSRLSVPLGITFVSKVYEAGFSTRDVPGLLTAKNPYLSVAMGVLRFKFGKAD